MPKYCPKDFRVYSQVLPSEWHDFTRVANFMLCLLYSWTHNTICINVWVTVRGRLDAVVNRKISISARNSTLISCPPSRRQPTVGYGTNCICTLNKQRNIKHETEKWRNERVSDINQVRTDGLKKCNVMYLCVGRMFRRQNKLCIIILIHVPCIFIVLIATKKCTITITTVYIYHKSISLYNIFSYMIHNFCHHQGVLHLCLPSYINS